MNAVRTLPRIVATLLALCLLVVAGPARSEPTMNLRVNWLRLAEGGAQKLGLLRNGIREGRTDVVEYGPRAFDPRMPGRHSDADIGSALQLEQPTTATPWFGVGPEVSIVARDWGGAKALLGGEIAVTDAIRPSRSFRMALARIRLGSGRIAPFLQLGAGEYRVDTDVVVNHMQDTELATQVGGGVEMHLAKTRMWQWDVAAEMSFTQLVRDNREPENVADSRMWNGLVASRIRF